MALPSWVIPTGLAAIISSIVWSTRKEDDVAPAPSPPAPTDEIPAGAGLPPREGVSDVERLRQRAIPFRYVPPPPPPPIDPPGGPIAIATPGVPTGPCPIIVGFDGVRRRGRWVPWDSLEATMTPFRPGEDYVILPDGGPLGRRGRCL